ncbi:protein S100-P [Rana temporaria]|uniref:protein S100-P n=1 Tax=Rana temporaria TaxID=8407 RepID=UPI001AACF462|nr:protein S100-P [Rana temporaria]
MTQLETSMVLLMKVFDTYACAEGKKETLSKEELKKLMEKELPGFLQGGKGKEDCDKLMKDLDENGDCEVDFKEFVIFIATITCLVHNKFQK